MNHDLLRKLARQDARHDVSAEYQKIKHHPFKVNRPIENEDRKVYEHAYDLQLKEMFS